MAEQKSPTKPKSKKRNEEPARPGDIMIVIGAKKKPAVAKGVQLWMLDGVEQTEAGDRSSVAFITTQQLHALGWVRRKH